MSRAFYNHSRMQVIYIYPTQLVIKYELIPDLIIEQQNAFQHNSCRKFWNCRLKSIVLEGSQVEKRWNGLLIKWLSVMHFEKGISQSNHIVSYHPVSNFFLWLLQRAQRKWIFRSFSVRLRPRQITESIAYSGEEPVLEP